MITQKYIQPTIFTAFVILLSLIAFTAHASTNLISGGDFSSQQALDGNWQVSGHVEINAAQAGAVALRGNDADPKYNYPAHPAGIISQEVATTPGEEYIVSYEVFGAYPYCKDNSEGTTKASAYIAITDDNGVSLKKDHASADLGTGTTTKTTSKSVTFTATTNSTKISFGKGAYEGAPFTTTPCLWTFVDNVSVIQKSAPAPVTTTSTPSSTTSASSASLELLLNGSFDTSASWDREGDAAYLDGRIQYIYGNYRTHTGSISQTILTKPGQTYTVTYETLLWSSEATDPANTVRYDLNFKAQSNGSTIGSKNYTKTLTGRGNNLAQKHTASFTATSPQTTLIFQGTIENTTPGYLVGEDRGDLIIELDNVSIEAGGSVTTPSTVEISAPQQATVSSSVSVETSIDTPTDVVESPDDTQEMIDFDAETNQGQENSILDTEESSVQNSGIDEPQVDTLEPDLEVAKKKEGFGQRIKNFFKRIFGKNTQY